MLIPEMLPFALSASLTPGPNNMMLTTSAANWGFVRTGPHMAGIMAGFFVMVMVLGLGLGQVMETLPGFAEALRWVGLVFLLWLAWRIALAPALRQDPEAAGTKPLSFLAAALFQWVNPKAWSIALAALGLYISPHGVPWEETLKVAITFSVANLASVTVWTGFGATIHRLIERKGWLHRGFNLAMAALMVGSFVWLVFLDA